MAILKKPEPKKRACKCATPASGLSTLLMDAAFSSEDIAMRREMNRTQLATMKADLRKHVADADLKEIEAKIAVKRLGSMGR